LQLLKDFSENAVKFGRGQVINHEGEKKMNENDVVIVSVARTPMGSFQGVFKGLTAAQLGAFAINAAVDRANLSANSIEEVVMGCVLPAGKGRRQRGRPPWVLGYRLLLGAQRSTRCVAQV